MESSKKYQTLLLSIGTKKKKKIYTSQIGHFMGLQLFLGSMAPEVLRKGLGCFFQVLGEAKNSLKCLVSEVWNLLFNKHRL